MQISKINNEYIIKILDKKIDIYNKETIEEITKKTILKIIEKEKLQGLINLEIFSNEYYGIIIKLKNNYTQKEELEVKIIIHINTPFLYKMDYFDIKENNLEKESIYYYQNNFFLDITKEISQNQYYHILELSDVTYEDTIKIINEGIKIKI